MGLSFSSLHSLLILTLPFTEPALGQGLSDSIEPGGQPHHQIHPLMENRYNQRGSVLTRKAKNIVILAVGHAQRRIKFVQVFKQSLTSSQARKALFQLGDVAPHLSITPLCARVADDLAQVAFRFRRENVRRDQLRGTLASSSSSRSDTLRGDSLPARPAVMRFSNSPFNSCQA